MTAMEKLTALSQEVARQRRIIMETDAATMAGAAALLAKWDTNRIIDAVACEAKCRALAVLNTK